MIGRLLCIALMAGGVGTSAAPQPAPAFDVASVRRNVTAVFPVGPEVRRGGSFVAIRATLERLVRFAYDLPAYQVIGGPDWARRDHFDVDARAANPEATAAELQQIVQALLRDRFELAVRRERREGQVYDLVVARGDRRLGGSLRPAAAGCDAPDGSGETLEEQRTPNGGVATRRTCVPLDVLVSSLADALRAPVTDQTSLAGRWDYELSFTGGVRRNASSEAVARDPNDAPELFTAVEEQLGVKLVGRRGLVDVLVIESATPPTAS